MASVASVIYYMASVASAIYYAGSVVSAIYYMPSEDSSIYYHTITVKIPQVYQMIFRPNALKHSDLDQY